MWPEHGAECARAAPTKTAFASSIFSPCLGPTLIPEVRAAPIATAPASKHGTRAGGRRAEPPSPKRSSSTPQRSRTSVGAGQRSTSRLGRLEAQRRDGGVRRGNFERLIVPARAVYGSADAHEPRKRARPAPHCSQKPTTPPESAATPAWPKTPSGAAWAASARSLGPFRARNAPITPPPVGICGRAQ